MPTPPLSDDLALEAYDALDTGCINDELITFCEGYAEAVEENQRLRAMLEAQANE